MSDLAFDNYCIACDKLCTLSLAAYCSNECKQQDESQASRLRQDAGASPVFAGLGDAGQDLVSPLLAPAVHAHEGYTTSPWNQEEEVSFDLDYNAIDLNYTESRSSDLTEHFPLTSLNYRKWLTACL